jgi:hypothetical protein
MFISSKQALNTPNITIKSVRINIIDSNLDLFLAVFEGSGFAHSLIAGFINRKLKVILLKFRIPILTSEFALFVEDFGGNIEVWKQGIRSLRILFLLYEDDWEHFINVGIRGPEGKKMENLLSSESSI